MLGTLPSLTVLQLGGNRLGGGLQVFPAGVAAAAEGGDAGRRRARGPRNRLLLLALAGNRLTGPVPEGLRSLGLFVRGGGFTLVDGVAVPATLDLSNNQLRWGWGPDCTAGRRGRRSATAPAGHATAGWCSTLLVVVLLLVPPRLPRESRAPLAPLLTWIPSLLLPSPAPSFLPASLLPLSSCPPPSALPPLPPAAPPCPRLTARSGPFPAWAAQELADSRAVVVSMEGNR